MKAQSALEYLIIISLLLAVLIPFVATSSKTWMLASNANDARDAVNTLAKAADFIYSSGGGRMQVTVRFPTSTQEFLVANRTIRLRSLVENDLKDAIAMTAGPVAGALSQLAGMQTVPVWMSQAGTVIIGYVLQLTPTAISYTLVPGVTNVTNMTVRNMLSQSVNGIGSSATGISFLSVTQPSANLTAGANSTFNATFSPSAAQAPGTYTGSIKVNNSEYDISTPVSVVIPLLLKMLGIVVCSDSECLNQTTQFYRSTQVWWRIYSKDQLSAAYDVTTLSSNLTNTSGSARYSASGQSTSAGMWNASYYFTSSDAAGSWNLSAGAYDSYVTVTNSTLLSVGATCPDSKAPWWSGQNQSASSVAAGQNVTLSARWMDDCQLVASKLATNKTGSYSNESTVVTLSGTQQFSSFAFNTSAQCGKSIGWKLWANDTSAKANETSVASFYVNFTASALKYANVSAIYNGTAVSGSVASLQADDGSYYVIASQNSGGSVSNSTTIQPDASAGKDTYLRESSYSNYDGNTEIRVGYVSAKKWRGLIEFSLSDIPSGSVINSAELQLYSYLITGSAGVALHRVTRSWTESGVEWYNYDGSNAWTAEGGDYASPAESAASGFGSLGWKLWNVTNLVRGWVNGTWSNYGMILMNDSASNTYYFYSSDYGTADYRPKIVVNYTIGSGVSAVVNLTLGSQQLPENSGAVDFKLNTKSSTSANTTMEAYNFNSSAWQSCWSGTLNSTESNATCSKGSDFINSTRNSLVRVSANTTTAFNLSLDYVEYNASYC